jgi:membrane-bound inhibitor of C-type lysozyme
MRARSSSLLVVVLLLASGCSRDDEAAVGVPSEPAPPEPITNPAPLPVLEPPRDVGPAPTRGRLVHIGASAFAAEAGDIGDVPTPALRRLVYQCSDEVTFAVRTFEDRLEVVPPGVANSYVVLTRMPVDSGARFAAPNADFRANGDLATLQIGSERYVDCVSNPAAAVWGTVQPHGGR